jgi:hypothetical protein
VRVLAERSAAKTPADGAAEPDEAADRLLDLGGALAVAAVVVQTVTHIVNFALFDLDVEQLDAGSDSSAWAWASSMAAFAAAFSALLLAAGGRDWRVRWLVLAGIVGFLSLDDLLQVHEYSGDFVEEFGIPEEWELRRAVWPAIFLPLLGTALLLMLQLARSAARRDGRFLRLGLAMLAAAVAIEALTPIFFWIDWEQETWPYELEQVVEEGAELAGWTLVAAGIAAAAVRDLGRSRAAPAATSPGADAPAEPTPRA